MARLCLFVKDIFKKGSSRVVPNIISDSREADQRTQYFNPGLFYPAVIRTRCQTDRELRLSAAHDARHVHRLCLLSFVVMGLKGRDSHLTRGHSMPGALLHWFFSHRNIFSLFIPLLSSIEISMNMCHQEVLRLQ